MTAPRENKDGSCPNCMADYSSCKFHRMADDLREKNLRETIRGIVAHSKAERLGRICAKYELESDEMMTREEKAAAYTTV